MNHTPGPWFSRRHLVALKDTYGEAYVTAGENDPYAQRPTSKMTAADADLIAAAPDLLSALINMVDDGDITDREQALAAIAKARGQSSN